MKFVKSCVIATSLAAFLIAAAQRHALCVDTFVVSGTVVDAVTKEPLEGAVVRIKESAQAVACDKDGKFTFETPLKSVTLSTELGGYKKYEKSMSFPYSDVTIELELSTDYTMGKVYVRDRKRLEGTKNKVQAEQIKKTTTHLFADSLKVLQTLPGVVTGDDFSSLMYVRGGEFYESVAFLDNIHILMPYMWGGNQSIFNPAFVDKVDFYSGGFPAKYPQAMSAVIDVKNIDGNFTTRNGYTDMSPTTFEYFIEGPAKENVSSYVFGLRRTYYDLIMNLIYGDKYKDIVFPYFYDSQAKFSWKINSMDKLSVNFLGSYEGMEFDSEAVNDPDRDDKTFKFSYRDSRALPAFNWERVYSDDVSLNVTMSLRQHEGSYAFTNEDVTATTSSKDYDLFLKHRLTYITGNHTLEQGAYMFRNATYADSVSHSRTLMPDGTYYYDDKNIVFDWMKVNAYGLYLQDDIALFGEKLFLNAGGLVEHFDYTSDTTFCPRAGVKYVLTEDITLRFNTGLYAQFPIYGVYGPPPFTENRDLKAEKSIHYVLGYEQEFPRHFFLRLETYRKDYFDRVIRDPNPALDYTNNGIRKAYGLDVFVQKKIAEKWDGWFTYSYLYAKDRIEQRNNPYNYAGASALDYLEPVGEWYPFAKERMHSMALVGNYEFNPKWKLAATWRFSSGTPYTDIVGASQYGTVYVPIFAKFQDLRMPDYQRLDVKLTMPFFDMENTEFYFQVINLLDHKNIDRFYYSRDYSKKYDTSMLTLIPIAGLKYYFSSK